MAILQRQPVSNMDVNYHAGGENWVHYSVEVATGAVKALTPLVGVHSKLIPSSISGLRPDELLFCMNIRDPSDFDVVSHLKAINIHRYIVLNILF